ncbi:hypothetical protein GEMRC1_013320 [Eukaryota sp. GEM-RC1]
MAMDYEARVVFVSDPVLGLSIYKLDDGKVFRKADGTEICTEDVLDTESEEFFSDFLTILFPPEEFEQGGSKTVGGTNCDIVKATVTVDGESHDLEWCIADGFVLEVDDGTGDDPMFVTDHVKLTGASDYFNESQFCDSIEPAEFVVKTSSLKANSFASRFLKKN